MLTRLAYVVLVIFIGGVILVVSRLPQVQFLETLAFEVLGPIQTGISAPIVSLDRLGQTVEGINQLQAENARLRAQVAELSQEAVLVPELQRENAQLRAEVAFGRSDPELRWITSRLLGFDPSNLVRGIIIDRGTRDGVAVGMTVVAPEGLVGQVVQAAPNTSKVLLISDVSSSVNALIQSNRAKGVVNGSRGGQLSMSFLSQGAKIQSGDRVITSGLGGVFPSGLLVGTVTQVHQNDVDLFQSADLDPVVNFDRLEEVMVITNYLPTKLQ